ncbi:hypothetical protein TcCL_NonESM10195 [Trypanosoma cruzi]|nr:hypothetical protein TcCL_NonESM10195 [Trypanosoma cruzi]
MVTNSQYCKECPYTTSNCYVSYVPSCGLGRSQALAFPITNDGGISAVDEAESFVVHLECPQLCSLRALPAGMLGTFCGDLCARRLLRRRWHHSGVRIRGLRKLSERQAEHVGHVPSYCGRTSVLCCRLGRRKSIRRSLVGKELRCSLRKEVLAEAAEGRSPQ